MSFIFEIDPYCGALPITFEMNRANVAETLGDPRSVQEKDDGRCSEYRLGSQIRIGYHANGMVRDISISPGEGVSLEFHGCDLLHDPRRFHVLLEADSAPEECAGFLIFRKIGIAMTGFHDGDDGQRSINVFSQGGYKGLKHVVPYDPALLRALADG